MTTVDLKTKYETVTTWKRLREILEVAATQGYMAFDLETDSIIGTQANIAGFAIATEVNSGYYVPCGHIAPGVSQLDLLMVIAELRQLLESPVMTLIMQNGKFDSLVMRRYGVRLNVIEDTMLISASQNGGKHRHNMDDLAKIYLGRDTIKFRDVCSDGQVFNDVALDPATVYAAEDADITLDLHGELNSRHTKLSRKIYETLERPLLPIVTDMEWNGVRLNTGHLHGLTDTFMSKMDTELDKMYDIADVEFNPASPMQIGALFKKMGIKTGKRTNTGRIATGAKVLEAVRDRMTDDSHIALVDSIQEWRKYSKLVGTYTKALPEHVNPITGKVHASFLQTGTGTGRFSSADPNLQNIPIRTQEGRQIREAFIPTDGHKLLAADYSQIELRIAAFAAQDEAMQAAFANGEDIHKSMAAKINGVPLDDVTTNMRRDAKSTNFGILYGTTSYGLSRELGISDMEAQDLIDQYFSAFPGLAEYMDNARLSAHRDGYVRSFLGRRIWLPDINSKVDWKISHAERQAVNAPIQGTAADVIKEAMIKLPDKLRETRLRAKMIMQVHDELVFEVPNDETDDTIELVVNTMESAGSYISHYVPLKVDASYGNNWDEAH